MANIEDLYNASDEELFVEVGAGLDGYGTPMLPPSRSVLNHRGRIWFEHNQSRFRERICQSEVIKRLSGSTSTIELVVAVAALIESVCSGTAVTPVAILLCRNGIQNICRAEWSVRDASTQIENHEVDHQDD